MSRAIITESKLTAIADAIRSRFGVSGQLTVDEMASEVAPHIPSEYQEVTYIQATGTQAIDTGVIPEANDIIALDIQMTEIPNSGANLYGADDQYVSTRIKYMMGYTAPNQNSEWQIAFEDWQQLGVQIDTNRHTFTYNGATKKAILDTTEISNTSTSNNVPKTTTCGLLARKARVNNTAPSSDCYVYSNMAKCKLYSCIITRNNKRIRYFVPCYRKSDNEIGLYDVIENQFYTNLGTGTFTKGADV